MCELSDEEFKTTMTNMVRTLTDKLNHTQVWLGSISRVMEILRNNRKEILRWVWWLTPVIPALWEVEADRSPEVRSSRPAWPTW